MRKLALIIVTFILFTIYHSLFTNPAHAEGEFETDYEVTYIVGNDGKTNVTQQIVLKNRTANFYADKFELKIGSTKVTNVQAVDSTGPLETEVKFENNVTSITVTFTQRVIGLNKTLPWTLTYTSEELANQAGQIWEVSIPRVADSTDIGAYTASVQVPSTFGQIAFAVPTPVETDISRATQTFNFDKNQLTQSGIAMSFGEKQVFSFNFNYYLENNNLTSQLQEISLPPDNNYQKVVFENIDPQPRNVIVDNDGNYLAQYRLSPKQKLDIIVSGSVEVFSRPFRNIYEPLTKDQKEKYTQPQRFWETDNAFIKEKAEELKTPEEIYNFVTGFLSYSESRLEQSSIEREGAANAIVNPKNAVCMEFTDLYIAIARAAGIPTREVQGFAYTENERLRPLSLALTQGDILHAWPEYWSDELGWVQIDPTWGSTSGGLDYFNKLDFNHITFVQRGLSSTTPHPAGAYKRQENIGKPSVFVSFSEELPQPTQVADLELRIPDKLISGIPIRVEAIARNIGPISILSREIALETDLKIISKDATFVATLPPFASKTAIFNLQTESFLSRGTVKVKITFGDQEIVKEIEVVPIYFLFVSKGFIASLIIAALTIITGFFVYKRLQKRKLPQP